MIAQESDALRIQLVDAPRACAAIAHQTRFLEHAQVLRHRGAGHRQPRSQFAHRMGMIAEHFEDAQSRGIAKSRESVLYVSIHLR